MSTPSGHRASRCKVRPNTRFPVTDGVPSVTPEGELTGSAHCPERGGQPLEHRRVDVRAGVAEGEDGDSEDPVSDGMDLLRPQHGGEPISELTAAPKDAAAEHERARAGAGSDGREGPRECGGRVVEDAVCGP